ncbi:Hint domain-containing protein [Archangium violaceum]|uniref:Hint domain-containing protein n=1 Tax=Archangium violaceum TaxID=83451 RepID=UPI0036DBD54F
MIRKILGGMVISAAAAVLLPAQAQAQVIISTRCTTDNLDTNAKAEARVEWARKCGTIQNVGDSAAWYDTALSAATGGTLKDYLESDVARNPDGEGAFTGPGYGFKVNYSAMFAVYLSGPTYQSQDARGYYFWWRDSWRKKGRALYPTFSTSTDIEATDNIQLFPHPTLADCRLYLDKNGAQPATSPFHVNGYCESACYTPEQKVLFSDGYMPIVDALKGLKEDLITLSPNATLDNLELQQNRTYSYTKEIRDAEHNIFVISTRSGGQLRVTHEHPIINGEGRMVQAQTLKVGDDLVKADGTLDAIVDIQKTTHYGRVYNIAPVTTDLVSNVLVAEGYLVGSVRYQNDEVAYINRIILYRGVPAEVIP